MTRWLEWARHIAAGPLGTIALALIAMAEATARVQPETGPDRPLHFIAFPLLALAATLPLLVIREQPAFTAVAVTAANVVAIGAFPTFTLAAALAQVIALFRSGRGGSRMLAIALSLPFVFFALVGTATSSVSVPVTGAHPPMAPVVPESAVDHLRLLIVLMGVLAPAAALAGIGWRTRREAELITAEKEVIAATLLEHMARGERARIARELHDVVAHHISMVVVQAETARLATPGMPDEGAERLKRIGDTARAALTEMRRLLGVLREDSDADVAVREPQPGLNELTHLIDEAREVDGSDIRLILTGEPAGLDPGVELAAYRIVQEALTNARRHAPGAGVDVELRYTPDELELVIRDNGPGPSGKNGHGLIGMRERAIAVGGELTTGPAAGGGFLIEARLPGSGTR